MPPLPTTFATLEEIPEGARSFFEQKDGKFVLQLQGVPVGFAPAADLATANGKVVELRDTNIAVVKAVKDVLGVEVGDINKFGETLKTKFEGVNPDEARALKTKFEGVDPVEYKTLKAQADELKNKGITKPDDVAAQIKQHVETALAAAITPLKTEITGLKSELNTEKQGRTETQKALTRSTFESQLTQAAIKAQVEEKMLQAFIGHAFNTYQLDGDKYVAKNGGAPVFSLVNPAEPISVEEWVATQLTVVPGFFKKSNGGGADPAANPGALRPGVTELVNPTPQQLGNPKIAKDIREGRVVVVNR